MGRVWRNLNRDLVPRRYTDVVLGIVLLAFGVHQATEMSRAWPLRARSHVFMIAVWGLLGCYTLASGAVAMAARRRRRVKENLQIRGRCRMRGYDLHAALSVHCPECGAFHGSTPGRRVEHEP